MDRPEPPTPRGSAARCNFCFEMMHRPTTYLLTGGVAVVAERRNGTAQPGLALASTRSRHTRGEHRRDTHTHTPHGPHGLLLLLACDAMHAPAGPRAASGACKEGERHRIAQTLTLTRTHNKERERPTERAANEDKPSSPPAPRSPKYFIPYPSSLGPSANPGRASTRQHRQPMSRTAGQGERRALSEHDAETAGSRHVLEEKSTKYGAMAAAFVSPRLVPTSRYEASHDTIIRPEKCHVFASKFPSPSYYTRSSLPAKRERETDQLCGLSLTSRGRRVPIDVASLGSRCACWSPRRGS
ncbi:hypothetical protein PCL_04039 [Purpureocillium lilacinum]|uniref:Uncharacterized protein n=1 Tax=Purpureocillium lilacinum TaxID=33203 RepID=A0A2U3EQS4_PURLI|nr:hypothetical protein PCL_04039 [Purpureocillium lilacinum]